MVALLFLSTIVLAVPILVFFVEVVAGLKVSEGAATEQSSACSVESIAVVVPAHNESGVIAQTLHDILPQLGPQDRLIVVADNCTDDTAEVAKAAGAEVVVRQEPGKIGKGYAMAWAIAHLSKRTPNLVLFVDADCRVDSDLVQRLGSACLRLNRPVQALYLMKCAENSEVSHGLSEFAWILKNLIRPLGLRFFNGPVQLMGTGMMFPWEVIKAAPLASGNLVEDLSLGLDLAMAGYPAHFFPVVKVTSSFPSTVKGGESQRQRWIQGHLATIFQWVPRLVVSAVERRDLNLLMLGLDLLVPPLSLLGLLAAGLFSLAFLAAAGGLSVLPLLVAAANLTLLIVGLWLAWQRFGRDILPAPHVRQLADAILRKLDVYGLLLRGRTANQWVRTDRTNRTKVPAALHDAPHAVNGTEVAPVAHASVIEPPLRDY